MVRLYYKSDYKIRETFKTQAGTIIDPRNFNFEFVFIAGKENTFTCSHTIGASTEWVNCVYDSVNNAVLCTLDNHNLLPGRLKRELTIEEPDSDFPDGKLDYITYKAYDIELVETPDGDSLYDIYDEEIVVTSGVNPVELAEILHESEIKDEISDDDEFNYLDSENGFGIVKTTWLNIKAKLKAYFDTIYASITHNHNLNDLTEKSYNSLTDRPSLDFEPANENIQSHIGDEDIHVTSTEKSTWSGKQDALTFSTNIETDKASTTKVSAIKTFYDWATGLFATITNLNAKADITPANGSTSALRALYIARGYDAYTNTYHCVYNSNTGFYEMNGLTDLTEAEMLDIYNASIPLKTIQLVGACSYVKVRTLYPIYYFPQDYLLMTRFCMGAASLITVKSHEYNIANALIQTFYACTNLVTFETLNIVNISSAGNIITPFFNCTNLTNVKLKGLKVAFTFASSPLLSLASLQYLVNNRANGNTRITITVHATVWSKLNNADDYPAWNALLVDAFNNQYINFASA